jgi:hypothetical protein
MVALLVSIFVLMMQCSENDSLNSFNGRMEVVSAPIKKEYRFSPNNYYLSTDSIKWLYEFPPDAASRLSIILSGLIQTYQDSIDEKGNTISIDIGTGQNHLDLEVETLIDNVPGIKRLAFDSNGVFLDTVPIATSPLSVILPQSSRLFVKIVDYPLDTIQIVNPHTGGQR